MASAADQRQSSQGSHTNSDEVFLDANSQSNDESHDASLEDSIDSPASVNSPPYWLRSNPHQRTISSISTESTLPAGAIRLRDNETSSQADRNNACWAKSVEINDFTVVNSSATNIGAFVVWNVRVETLNVSIRLLEEAARCYKKSLC